MASTSPKAPKQSEPTVLISSRQGFPAEPREVPPQPPAPASVVSSMSLTDDDFTRHVKVLRSTPRGGPLEIKIDTGWLSAADMERIAIYMTRNGYQNKGSGLFVFTEPSPTFLASLASALEGYSFQDDLKDVWEEFSDGPVVTMRNHTTMDQQDVTVSMKAVIGSNMIELKIQDGHVDGDEVEALITRQVPIDPQYDDDNNEMDLTLVLSNGAAYTWDLVSNNTGIIIGN